jgi:tryptophan synthase beta chain
LKDIGRAEYVAADDEEALEAFKELTKVEGIMPALETAHGIAYVKKLAPTMSKEQTIIVNVSGRGDKDINTVASIEGIEL